MFSTLRTLMRASAAEAEDALIDGNAVRLLAQHLRDARDDVIRARHTLAGLVAREKEETRRITEARSEIARREEDVAQALAAAEETLAGDLADRIVGLEDRIARSEVAQRDLAARITALRETIAKADRRIATLADELRAARAGAVSRKTTASLGAPGAASALQQAEAMSERLRRNGARIDDQIDALADPALAETADLDSRLRAAGIADDTTKRRNAIIDRLKTRPAS